MDRGTGLILGEDHVDFRIEQHSAEVTIEEILAEDRERSFDPGCDPLIRLRLIERDGSDPWLALSNHHVLMDGWSLAVLFKDLLDHYGGEALGSYLPWHERAEEIAARSTDKAMAYWGDYLAECEGPSVLHLPEPAQTLQGIAELSGSLDEDQFKALRTLAMGCGVTTATVVQGAYMLVVSQLCRQDVVTIGTTRSGRHGIDSREDTGVGLYINTLPVVARLDQGGDLASWLQNLQVEQAEQGPHEHVALGDVQRLVAGCSGTSTLFEALYVYENYPVRAPANTGTDRLEFSLLTAFDATQYPLALQASGTEALGLRLTYDRARLDGEAAERIMARLLHTLDQLCAPGSLGAPLSALSLTPASDLAAISAFNDTEHPLDELDTEDTGLLPDLLSRTARDHADATALVFEGEALGYAELEARSNALARHLISLGAGPDTVVAIALERSFEMVIALMAVLKAGGAYLPLDPDYPQDRLAYMLEDSKADILVTRKEISDRLSLVHNHAPAHDAPAHIVSLEDTRLHAALDRMATHAITQDERNTPLKPDHLAYVIYTSGSTGKPKGVGNTHDALFNRIRWMAADLSFNKHHSVLQKTAFGFDVSVWEFILPLLYGARMVIARPSGHKDPNYLSSVIEDQKITTLHFVPSMLDAFLESEPEPGSLVSIEHVVTSGEALSEPSCNSLAKLIGTKLHNYFGPTEAAIDVTAWSADPAHTGSPPIGSPIWNTEIHVVDGFLRRVPVGVWGEMYISGAGLARGYVGRPDLTAERFVACPFGAPGSRMYRTGDLGRWRADGVLEFGGRCDDQVKLRGFRIEPGEIEAVLVQQPGIAQAAVVLRDVAGEKRLVAYVTAEAETAAGTEAGTGAETGPDTEILRRGLEASLPDYMVPSAFMVLDALPLSPSGKLDRRALPDPEFTGSADYTPPETADEALLCRLFEELTSASRVSVTDSFFALGGHSLMAMRLVAAIRKERGVELPLRAVFAQQNPRALARALALASVETLGAVIAGSGVGDDGIAALSLGQERLWSLDQLEGGQSAQYNIPVGLRLEGDLDTSALEHALRQIVDHHAVLRTVIEAPDGVPTGRLLALSSFENVLREIDLRDQPDDALEQLQAFAARPFDLSSDLRLRGLLVRTGEQSWDLALVAHHGAFDGSSFNVFLQELSQGYRAALGKEDYSPAPLAWSFADWAVWQRDWLKRGGLEKSLSYWEEHLAGAPALLELPTDHDRQENRARHAGYADITLPSDMRVSLEALALDRGTTLFGVLMGAYGLMLSRLAGQDEVVVGTPSAGRVLSGSEALVGFFVNTLALRLTPGMSQTLGGYLDTVTSTVREGLEHEAAPFELVVERACAERSLSHTPVFQAMFAWQNQEAGELDLPGLSLSPRVLVLPQAKYDLSLSLAPDMDGGITGAIEYDADLFTSETVERWTTLLLHTLDQLCAPGSLGAPLSALSLTPASDLAAISAFNDTEHPLDELDTEDTGLLPDLLSRTARDHADATALVFEGEALGYAELEARSNALARHLISLGAGPDTVVAIALERSFEMVIALMAVLKAGGAYLPLDPDYPQDRLAYMLEDSKADILVTRKEISDRLSLVHNHAPAHDAPAHIVSLEDTRLHAALDRMATHAITQDERNTPLKPDHLAYVIYTSGSTGKPKGRRQYACRGGQPGCKPGRRLQCKARGSCPAVRCTLIRCCRI